ncbi:uncharacterized protein LOC141525511 [Cotesia typhae]|uniref:uncharacterized protein LOC141525511 n=1 Tax=Cotesia typhae TaxID=2053667 RepID=UPI003D69268C
MILSKPLIVRKTDIDIHESIMSLMSFVNLIKTTILKFRSDIKDKYNKYLTTYFENPTRANPRGRDDTRLNKTTNHEYSSNLFPFFRKITGIYDATMKSLFNFLKAFDYDIAKVTDIASKIKALRTQYENLTKKFAKHQGHSKLNQLHQLNEKFESVILNHNKLVSVYNAVIVEFIVLKKNLTSGLLLFTSMTGKKFAFSIDDELAEFQRLIDIDLSANSTNRANVHETFTSKFKKDLQQISNSSTLMPVTQLQMWKDTSGFFQQKMLESGREQAAPSPRLKPEPNVGTGPVKFSRINKQKSFKPRFISNILPEDLRFDNVFGNEMKHIDEISELIKLAAKKWMEVDVDTAILWENKHYKKFFCTQFYSKSTSSDISNIKSMYKKLQARMREIEFQVVKDKDDVGDLLDCILDLDASIEEVRDLKLEYLQGNLKIYGMLNSYFYFFKSQLISKPEEIERLIGGIEKLQDSVKDVDLYSVLNYFGERLLHLLNNAITQIKGRNEPINDSEELFVKFHQEDIYLALRNIVQVKDKTIRGTLKFFEQDYDRRPFERFLLIVEGDVNRYNLKEVTQTYHARLNYFNDIYLESKFCNIE